MKKRLDLALLIGIIASVALTSLGVFARDCDRARERMLRLHILAASDSEEDQRDKYAVRDRLLAESADLFAVPEKASALAAVAERLPELERIASEVLTERGTPRPVKAELVHMYFGTRIYDGVTVAAGWYDTVRITIGEGQGKNWWCVMFPPMCLPAAEADSDPREDQERLEELGRPEYIPKFAVVELIEQARNHLSPQEEQSI